MAEVGGTRATGGWEARLLGVVPGYLLAVSRRSQALGCVLLLVMCFLLSRRVEEGKEEEKRKRFEHLLGLWNRGEKIIDTVGSV